MFWLKIFVFYPLLAFILYTISGQHLNTMWLSILMLAMIKLAIYLLTALTNKET